jgi:hypothetical protein
MSENILTRKQLYDLVWSKPVTHIAKEYGFSDNGIRKICKKNNIPLPKNGYWSKIKFNKKVTKTKLPKQDDNPQITLEKSISVVSGGNHINSQMALRKKELKEIEDLTFTVPDRISKPHKYVTATKEYHKQLKIIRKRGGWSSDVDSSDALNINVSESLVPRALRIFDTLLKVFDKRGYKISSNKKTEVTINGQSYSIRITEKSKRVKREDNRSWDSYVFVPTGRLCLKIDDYSPIKEWADSKTKQLEERVLDILSWLEIRAKKDEEQAIQRALWRKKIEEEREREKQLQALKDNELNRFQQLFDTASRWHKSQYLRNYINEFEKYALDSKTLDPDKQEWIKWAKEKADWYDPFIEKEVDLLKDVDRDTLKSKKKNYW